jgi:Fe-S cluster assembly ATP-binding protein
MNNINKIQEIITIHNLHAKTANVDILCGVNLSIKPGEVHAIMGPNGSGKSTLSKVIAGHPAYEVTHGNIYFENLNITQMAAEDRARSGIFLAFQYPVEIPGVSNADFLRLAYNSKRQKMGLHPMDPLTFFDFINEKLNVVSMDPSFLSRNVNEGFSGGEKKRNEILQMAVLEPKIAILDETDSGLDIDALKIVANGINSLKNPNSSIILITHYQRLLEYVKPDYVHIMKEGKIIQSGDYSLSQKLEAYGYKAFDN